MKKLFTLFALCTLTLAANATKYNYLCGITDLTVDTLQSTTKNQYTITFSQKCKNTAEYTSKPETFYTSTVKIVLNSTTVRWKASIPPRVPAVPVTRRMSTTRPST